ncbi:unnamed protein product, partial [Cochlearia groenlandica]
WIFPAPVSAYFSLPCAFSPIIIYIHRFDFPHSKDPDPDRVAFFADASPLNSSLSFANAQPRILRLSSFEGLYE